jgi:photosystem II stability/assembly factor-like uncharacterized protein
MVHTEDGGRNWTNQSSGVNAWLESVTFAKGESGGAVGHGGTILHWEE